MKMASTEKNKTITIGSKILNMGSKIFNGYKKAEQTAIIMASKLLLLPSSTLDRHLLEAVEKGDLEDIKFLIKAGADANVSTLSSQELTLKNRYGDTMRPLEYAIYKRNYELASFLAQKGATLDAYGIIYSSYELDSLFTDLSLAEFKQWVTLLVDCNYLKYKSMNYSLHMPTLRSIIWKRAQLSESELTDFREKFKTIIELGFGKGEHGLLSEIAQKGDIGVLKMMLQNGFDAKKIPSNETPLLHALYFRDNQKTNRNERSQVFRDIVTLFDVDVNAKYAGGTILHFLILENESEQIKFLLQNTNINTAIKNDAGQTALDMAIEKNQADCMKVLLSTEPKRTIVLNQLLVDAVSHSAIDCAKVLLDMGADVNGQNGKDKLTPLMKVDTLEMAKLLIDNGAEVGDMDKNGKSVLHHLIQENAPREIIEMVLDNGANVNAMDKNGKTVLMSLPANREDVLSLLLVQPQVSLNTKDENGNTALMHYTKENNLSYVRMLCLVKADLKERNNDGKTALMIASENDNQVIQKELHRFISANYLPIQTSVSIVRKPPQTITLPQRDNAVNSIGD